MSDLGFRAVGSTTQDASCPFLFVQCSKDRSRPAKRNHAQCASAMCDSHGTFRLKARIANCMFRKHKRGWPAQLLGNRYIQAQAAFSLSRACEPWLLGRADHARSHFTWMACMGRLCIGTGQRCASPDRDDGLLYQPALMIMHWPS